MMLAADFPFLARIDTIAECAQAVRPDIGIAGRSTMITACRSAVAELAVACNNRGLLYRDLNKDRVAIKDFGEAVILAPEAVAL